MSEAADSQLESLVKEGFITVDGAPSGTVLIVEPSSAHEQFLQEIPSDLTVVLRINHVQTLLNRGETRQSFFGEGAKVITTTTVHDQRLADLSWEFERDLISEFEPDFHIPCDYPVYKGDTPSSRRKNIFNYLEGMIWMAWQLRETSTRVLPLLKGVSFEERRLTYEVLDYLDIQHAVFYGTQYFSASVGFYTLLKDIRQIASEEPNLELMLVGLQAPKWLESLPPQVVAAAGQRWIGEVGLRDASPEAWKKRFEELDTGIESALGQGQVPIQTWMHEEVTV